MEFKELKDFIQNKMLMQHIYQPVMIKTILESNNKASIRDIAKSFLELDESQIDYYKEIVQQMPGKVLKKHNIVSQTSDRYSVNITDLSHSQILELISLCNTKIADYIRIRGGERQIWLHRMKSSRDVPGNIRYEVLKRAKGKCELCGTSKDERRIDVDHIIPRNKQGKSIIENYQALCYRCNSQKGDKDNTDFRPLHTIYDKRDENCPFCDIHNSFKVIKKNDAAIAFEDKYPIVKNHLLITPFRHTASFFDLSSYEIRGCFLLISETKKILQENDNKITGFNVGFNDGIDAGQTIFHCHIHLIPRRKGDVSDPIGGIRNIIPGKGNY